MRQIISALRIFFRTGNLEPEVVQAHRELLLTRTRLISLIALGVLPFTVLTYFYFAHRDLLLKALPFMAISELGLVFIVWCVSRPFFRKHYHLPVFFLVAFITNFAESSLISILGGGGNFLFPYLLMNFGVATFLPGKLLWIAVTLGVLPPTYLLAEWIAGRGLHHEAVVSNLIYLTDVTVMAIIGSQVILSLFLREKRSQLQLYDANAKLQELDKTKSEFFSNISHELKTPTTLVMTTLENELRNLPRNDSEIVLSRSAVQTIRQNALRLGALIDGLLDLTRSEIGKERINAVEIHEPRDFFEGIFQSIAPLLEEKGLLHTFEIKGHVNPHYFDRDKIDKVVINLLSNAIKFTPRGGKVLFRLWDEEEVLKFQVEDTGNGIPKDKLPQIFERFMQVDASSTRAYGGMGIGLSLVKNFVEFHGGTVEVESEVGNGTIFTISLPRGKEHFKVPVVDQEASEEGTGIEIPKVSIVDTMKNLEASENDEKIEEDSSLGSETVLIVDDHPDMRNLLKSILQTKYRILLAKDGEEGVKIAKEKKPSLVISDIMMPKKDGYGLLQDLKKDPSTKETPIILVTAKSGEESVILGFKLDADDYIAKPFRGSEVLARVKNLLDLRRAHVALARQQTLEAIRHLAAGIAHNINNLAMGASDATENLKDLIKGLGGILNEKMEMLMESSEWISKPLSHIVELVQKLMTFSRLNEADFSKADIEKCLSDSIQMTQLMFKNRLKISTDYQASTTHILCSPQDLNIAFVNLLKNSGEAIDSKRGGEIWVRTKDNGESLIIEIEDNGIGMDEATKRRIFDPFFTTKDVGQRGTGIGLTTVHDTIEAHHGSIKVESQPGKGTTFQLSLPVIESASTQEGEISHDRDSRA